MGHGQAVLEDELTSYRDMLDSITGYEVVRLDEHGRVRSWHTGAERLTGYPAQEVLGRPFSVCYPDDDTDRLPAELRAAADTGQCETEGWQVRKDGERIWTAASITPIREPGG